MFVSIKSLNSFLKFQMDFNHEDADLDELFHHEKSASLSTFQHYKKTSQFIDIIIHAKPIDHENISNLQNNHNFNQNDPRSNKISFHFPVHQNDEFDYSGSDTDSEPEILENKSDNKKEYKTQNKTQNKTHNETENKTENKNKYARLNPQLMSQLKVEEEPKNSISFDENSIESSPSYVSFSQNSVQPSNSNTSFTNSSMPYSNTITSLSKPENSIKIPAHRMVLAACSPYFYSMFNSEMRENNSLEIEMYVNSPSALSSIIDSFYGTPLQINLKNVAEIIYLARYLNMTDLYKDAELFMNRKLCLQTGNFFWTLGEKLGNKALVENCFRYLLKNFQKYYKTKEWAYGTPFSRAIRFLESDELEVNSEYDVFKAVNNYQTVMKKSRYLKLVSKIRFELIPCGILAEIKPIQKKNWSIFQFIQQALLGKTYKQFERKNMDGIAPIYIFNSNGGQRNNSGKNLNKVELWLNGGELKTTVVSPICSRTKTTAVYMNEYIYLIGGFDGHNRLKSCERFDPKTSQWKQIAPLNVARSHVSCVVSQGRLFAVGGYDGENSLSSCEIYNDSTNKWDRIEDMNQRRSNTAIVSYQGTVWVIGGNDLLTIFDTVERYCDSSKVWMKMRKGLMGKRCRHGAVVFDNKIYVIGGYDGNRFLQTVECYETRNTYENVNFRFTQSFPMLTRRARLSVCVSGRKIYAFGGYNHRGEAMTTVESIDPAKIEPITERLFRGCTYSENDKSEEEGLRSSQERLETGIPRILNEDNGLGISNLTISFWANAGEMKFHSGGITAAAFS